MIANTGQHEGVEAPPVLLPSSLDGAAGGEQPLAGKTAGICWKVSPGFNFQHVVHSRQRCTKLSQQAHRIRQLCIKAGCKSRQAAVVAPAKRAALPCPNHPSPLQWFDDAAPAVAHACNAAVSLLEAKGLKVVEIQVR